MKVVVDGASGESVARETIADMRGQMTLVEATSERVLAAARIKAEFPMALGDAFAAATAMAYDAPLLTGDPELLERQGPWRTEDLRSRTPAPRGTAAGRRRATSRMA